MPDKPDLADRARIAKIREAYEAQTTDEERELFARRTRDAFDWSVREHQAWFVDFIERRVLRPSETSPQAAYVEECLHAFLERDSRGLLVLSAQRRVVWQNRVAAGLLEGGWLEERADARGAGEENDSSLAAELKNTMRDPARGAGACVLSDSEGNSLLLVVEALQPHGAQWRTLPFVIVRLARADAGPTPDAALLERWFGLTAAECRLALAFAAGTTLDEFAAERGVSITTVRTQFARIRAKTGARNQVELLRSLTLASH